MGSPGPRGRPACGTCRRRRCRAGSATCGGAQVPTPRQCSVLPAPARARFLPGHLSALLRMVSPASARACSCVTAPGLAEASPPPPDASKPRVTIVNRVHRAGRSIVTAPEALEQIQASAAAYSSAQLLYMEGKSFRTQVRPFCGFCSAAAYFHMLLRVTLGQLSTQ